MRKVDEGLKKKRPGHLRRVLMPSDSPACRGRAVATLELWSEAAAEGGADQEQSRRPYVDSADGARSSAVIAARGCDYLLRSGRRAAEDLGADGAFFRVHHFARQLAPPFPLLNTSSIRFRTHVVTCPKLALTPARLHEPIGASDRSNVSDAWA
jgi:hypothetical protein